MANSSRWEGLVYVRKGRSLNIALKKYAKPSMKLIAWPKPVPFVTSVLMAVFCFWVGDLSWAKADYLFSAGFLAAGMGIVIWMFWAFKFIELKDRQIVVYGLIPMWSETFPMSDVDRFTAQWKRWHRYRAKHYRLKTKTGQKAQWMNSYMENWERLESAIRWLQDHPDRTLADMLKDPKNFEHRRRLWTEVSRLNERIYTIGFLLPFEIWVLGAFIYGNEHGVTSQFTLGGIALFYVASSVYWMSRWVQKKREWKRIIRKEGIPEDSWLTYYDEY